MLEKQCEREEKVKGHTERKQEGEEKKRKIFF